MLRVIRSRVFLRQLHSRPIATTRTMLMDMQTARPSLTSLNNLAAMAQLDLNGTLEEMAASHFSESSAFPEFSPMEDALLSQAMPRIKPKAVVMDAHAVAEEHLTAEIQEHFCEPSDFPEYTFAEEEAMMLKEQ